MANDKNFKVKNGLDIGGNLVVSGTSGTINGNDITTQGNTFNGVSQLVQLDGSGNLPAVDGSALTGIDSLPDQTGNTDKFLTTNGTVASWADVATGSEHYDQESEPTPVGAGATWYVPSTGFVYKRVNDGVNDIWIDVSTSGGSVTQSYVDNADALKINTSAIGVSVQAYNTNLDTLNRIDKVIQNKNIISITYTGGSNSDKMSAITYSENYAEDIVYNVDDKIEFIDHKLNGTVEGYTTMTYTASKLTGSTFTLGVR